MPTTRSRSALRRITGALVIVALTLPVLALVGAKVADRMGWARTAAITSGSMTGFANEGDLVIALPKPADEVRVGDVLTRTVSTPGLNQYITHRVTKVSQVDGAITVRTKGDYTSAEDVEATRLGDTAMVVHTVVPKVGHAFWWISLNRTLVLVGGAVVLVVYLLVGALIDYAKARRRSRRKPASAQEYGQGQVA